MHWEKAGLVDIGGVVCGGLVAGWLRLAGGQEADSL